MFGKLYRREFLEKWNIRFNTSLSNEDTGLNSVVRGCTERILYIPKPVYIWQFKANSITRIREGMYGSDSGYKGWADNALWQILELKKRYVNRNYILAEMLNTYCVFYHFHVENMQRYPLNTEISLNWARAYWKLAIEPYKEYITDSMIYQHFVQVAAGQNIAAKGIIPQMTFDEFRAQVEDHDYIVDPDHEICGATPAGHIPEITSPEWPVEITDYYDGVEGQYNVNDDTNQSRYGGMKRKLGIEASPTDYQASYTGAMPLTSMNTTLDNPPPEADLPPVRSDTPPADKTTIVEGTTIDSNNISGKKFGEIKIPPSPAKFPIPPEMADLERNTQEMREIRQSVMNVAEQVSPPTVGSVGQTIPLFTDDFKPPVGRSFGTATVPGYEAGCDPCRHCKG